MFHSARLKLTAWYLLIIMLISILFSFAIYTRVNRELERIELFRQTRLERLRNYFPQVEIPNEPSFDPNLADDSRNRLIFTLVLINLGIFVFAGGAGYFLAGRTLKPIKEMLDEQNRFITDASHELRTPLTSLKSEIEVNLRDQKLTLAEARKLLASNLEEVNNLQSLSDSLIKIAQHQNVNGDLNFLPQSLKLILNDAKKRVAKLASAKNIKIQIVETNIKIDGDKQTLTELFVILLDNAIKYSQKNKSIVISSKNNDGSISVSVSDQGFGINQKEIPHLFDRFFRSERSRTKEHAAGYGLGLSIAKQIVEKHQGAISVKSKIGKGSTFTILLPQKVRK